MLLCPSDHSETAHVFKHFSRIGMHCLGFRDLNQDIQDAISALSEAQENIKACASSQHTLEETVGIQVSKNLSKCTICTNLYHAGGPLLCVTTVHVMR